MVHDQAQLPAAQRGDVHAFNQLVLTYQDRVFSTAYRILGDEAMADDIAQETFVTAFRKLSQFKEGNFGAWLTRITINACYDELRRIKRQRSESLDDSELDEDLDPRLISAAPSPENMVQRAELQAAIEDCFQLLTDDQRLAVFMSDVEEYSYEEIARTAKISLGTVKSRISRARLHLRDCLRSKGELLPAAYRSNNEISTSGSAS